MFSLDQWAATPPLSALISILMIAGIDRIGIFSLGLLGFDVNSRINWVRWQAPVVGAMLLAIFLYPLALAGFTPLRLMQCIAFICIVFGILHLLKTAALLANFGSKVTVCWTCFKKLSISYKLLLVMLAGMGLLSLGPVTNADALDYHIGFAIAVLNNGGVPVTPEWFLGRLSGNGEMLIAMALSVGAEQFGSLLQYVSLLGIVGMVLFAGQREVEPIYLQRGADTALIALAAFSVPALLFLISSPKPQMWPIAMTTFAFVLVVHPLRRELSRRDAFLGFGLVCTLVMTATQAKFNYLLGGGLVGMFALAAISRQGFFGPAVVMGLIVALCVMGPSILWKTAAFNTGWFDVLTHPLPGHLPGTDVFINLAKGAPDMASPLPFPLLMLIPNSLGGFSTLLGIGFVVLVGLRPGRDPLLWGGLLVAVTMVLASAVLAPPSSRMYLEPYYWLMLILILQPSRFALEKMRWVQWAVCSQAVAVTVVCWLGAIIIFPGALLPEWRLGVMQQAANGYEVMKWADSVLPKNAVVLNGHRSMAILPREAISYDWSYYVDETSEEAQLYLNRLKYRGVSHMLVIGSLDKSIPLAPCFGQTIAGPGIGHLATRNPFNQGGKYEAWIVELDANRLPECARSEAKIE